MAVQEATKVEARRQVHETGRIHSGRENAIRNEIQVVAVIRIEDMD